MPQPALMEPSVEPFVVNLRLVEFQAHIHRLTYLDPIHRAVVTRCIEELETDLSKLRMDRSEYQSMDRRFLIDGARVFVEPIKLSDGSIIATSAIVLSVLLTAYNGVANYANFKVGLEELRKDIDRAVDKFKSRLARSVFRVDADGDGSPMTYEQSKVSSQEIFDILDDAIDRDG